MKYILSALFTLLVFSGCGSDDSATSTPATDAPASTETSNAVNEIVISPIGDQLKFATEAFTVKAGSKVKIVMDNVATMEVMQHNVVILAPGSDTNAIGTAGMAAGPDKDYIPEDAAVLFYTPIAKPGEKTVVEFTAPEPGEYPFICTYPGHYGVMKGIMTVE